MVLLFVLWCDLTQAVNIVVTVKQCEVHLAHIFFINFQVLHVFIHSILADQSVSHLDSEWFDRVTVTDLEDRKVFIIIVRDFLLATLISAS